MHHLIDLLTALTRLEEAAWCDDKRSGLGARQPRRQVGLHHTHPRENLGDL